jgi:hypothetical protein
MRAAADIVMVILSLRCLRTMRAIRAYGKQEIDDQ